MSEAQPMGIAIVGLAGRFPGACDVEAFWRNLRDGVESITFFNDDELVAAGVDPTLLAEPNYVRAGAIINDPAMFDAGFFGINRREAELMDPQHRLFLEGAWEALENAGYDPEQYAGAIGVYAGMRVNTYLLSNLISGREFLDGMLHFRSPHAFLTYLCSDKDFLTSRVAYKLNLRGPAVSVQTACSTSLVAVCQACESLLAYSSDIVLAGGSSITFPQVRGYLAQEGGMVSPDGHTRSFDARAQGTVFGSGVGIVVLKRLDDALADGDTIHAVIKGFALNNDGSKKVSYSAPAIDGQAEVISLAQAVAGVNAGTIGYIEAHGTATPLGEPIEVAALTQAFRQTTDKTGFCAIGSAKSNVGHLDSSAGITGLIKAVLAVERGEIPPSLHFETPNPNIDFANSPFFVNTELREWPRLEGAPRRGGVSSFGVGGTNAHVVIEEAPAPIATSVSSRPQLLLVSARSKAALEKATDQLAAHLRANSAANLADIAHTLRVGRRTFAHRHALVAGDCTEAATALEARNPKNLLAAADAPVGTSVVFLFPGQGAQYAGMGRGLCATEPVFATAFDRCDELLRPHLGQSLREILHSEGGSSALLNQTQFSQPAIFVFEYALAQLWMAWGVEPRAFVGHSVGEYVAACLAGVFSLEDALALVARRAQLVQALPAGAMLGVRLGEAELASRLPPELSVAAVNSRSICVVAGAEDAIAAFERELYSDGIAARRLASTHAFHSAMVEPAVAPFTAEVEKVALHPPRIPFVSCVTGQWITDALTTSPSYWAQHLRGTVRFADAVATLCTDPATALLEVGPGQTLAPLVRQHPARAASQPVLAAVAETNDEPASLARAASQLWLAGVALDWKSFVGHETRRRVPLPTYPFERERYWVEAPKMTQGDAARELPAFTETKTSATSATSDAAPARPVGVLPAIKELLAELSGQNLADVSASTTLLELGFDSLFLTQVSTAIEKRFQVRVSFRQLLNELGTLEALAAYLVAQASRLPCSGVSPGNIYTGKTPVAAGGTPAPPPVAHGPIRPMQRELPGRLTPRQQAFLDGFLTRYSARTAASKRYASEHRPHFADPRSIAGFKQAWKEIVYPIVVERSAGAKLWDVDGNEYIDITCGFGAALFGHQPDFITDAINAQLARGIEIGPTSPLAGEVAAMICEMTGLERAAFCNTGSEAITGALRIARTVSSREKIVIFAGSYHGISDEVLVRQHPSGDARAMPIASGIPAEMSANVIVLDYGDAAALETIRANAHELAAVLVEPVQSRRPEFQPRDFLHTLRDVTASHGIALIFDEVITGFRSGPAGAQGFFGVRADIATYGKVLGGGLPIGIIAGSAEYLDALDGGAWRFGDDSFPEVGVTFFAGTFSRHPLALAAAKAVLTRLREESELQEQLSARATAMLLQIEEIFAGTPFEAPHFASSFMVRSSDFACSGLLFALLREKGLHIWENRPCFLSTAHTDDDIAQIVAAFRESVAELRLAGFFAAARPANEIPITSAQCEIWLACQLDATAASSFNETWTLRLDGPLDPHALRSATQMIVERHDALRATVSVSGDALTVAEKVVLEVPLVDLAALSEEERARRFEELRAAEGQHVFDLGRGPLLFLQLVRLAPESHALIFNAHHIVCDGWSCDVFLHELASIYSALRADGPPALPAAMQMRDYQRWTEALRATPEFAADVAYWREKYRVLPPQFDLPSDRPHPKSRSYRGASEIFILRADLPDTLAKFGAQHGATLFSVLLAAFETLLYRQSGQRDFVVGMPASGQNLAGGEHLIGHCVNLLPLRAHIDGAQPFTALLTDVQSEVLEAFEHQRVSFGWLLEQLALPRVPGRVPLVPVTFNLDPPLSHIAFDGLTHRLEANPRSAFQFDLGFNCDTSSAGFRLICHYNTDLFDASTIRGWMAEYRALLEAVVADRDASLEALISRGERVAHAPPRAVLGAPAEDLAAPCATDSEDTPTTDARTFPAGAPETAREGACAPQNATAGAPREPIALWPSSPSAGGELLYDDVLYNAMTLDKSRHDCYRRAFRKTVRDKVVVDIGTGRDALLARMSIEEGAAKVYAIEILAEPARHAQALVESLGLAGRIVVIHARSQEVELPELADIVISENVGHIGGAEGGDLLLNDARRFLKPGGLIIPGRCTTKFAALSLPDDFLENPGFEELGAHYAEQVWRRAGHKHDFRLCLTGTSREFLRSTEAVFEEVDFAEPPVPEYQRPEQLEITRTGRIDGFLLWLQLESAAGETLESIDHTDSWLPIYLPVFCPPIDVTAGDRIETVVSGSLSENGLNRDYWIAGRVIRQSGGSVEFTFDSWHGQRAFKATPFYQRLFRDDSIRVTATAEQIADSKPALLESGPALSATERQRILVDWNRTERPFPQRGVHRVFEEQAALTPDAAAVESSDDQLTYAELNRRANQLSRALTARGLKPGACAAIALDRSAKFVIATLAILKAGAAYVPVDPSYPATRIALMLEGTAAAVVVTREVFAARLPVTQARIVIYDALDLDREESSNPGDAGTSEDLAYVMFTSGSTGEPNAVEIAHRGIARLVINCDHAPLGPGDRVAFASNVSFDATTFEIWGPLLNGGTVVVTAQDTLLSADLLAAHLVAERITAMFLTTSLFNQMAAIAPGMFGGVRHLLFGGEAADPQAVQRVLSGPRPQRLLNVYGPTEATTFATAHIIQRVDGPRIPIGRPIANTKAWILDETLAPVPVGVTGELFLGGPGLARGYRGAPELTAKRFVETPFGRLYRTGDLACWLPDGSIDCLGRADDQIKVRGFRVEPGEIEAVLRQQPGVKDCRVVAVQPDSQPKQLIAYFISNGSKPRPTALQTALARVLPAYMMPAAFVPVTAFPLTPNGKLDCRALPSPDTAADADFPISPGPRNGTEREVAAIWSELLGRERIGIGEDFFLLGGHSLLAIRMIAALRERFGVELPVRRLFETPTVEAIAEFISTVRPPAREMPSLVPLQRGKAGERPFFLVPGGWGGEIELFIYTHIIRNLGADLPIYGLRRRGADGMHEPHGNVEEMVADYVAEIRTRQPRGPYTIGGECIGGIVAYEMARLFEAQGEKVDLLVLLDTDVPTPAGYKELAAHLRKERWRNFWEVQVVQRVHGHLEKLSSLSLPEKWRYIRERARRRAAKGESDATALSDHGAENYREILFSHRLQPYGGLVTLLISEESHRKDADLGWRQVKTGGIEVHVLPGDHFSYIRNHAPEAAAKLRELIDRNRRELPVC